MSDAERLAMDLAAAGYDVVVRKDCPTCGHLIADHTAMLRCRHCENECGLDCSRSMLGYRTERR